MNKKEKKARAQRRNQERTTFNVEHANEIAEKEERRKAHNEAIESAAQQKRALGKKALRFSEVLDQCKTHRELAEVNVSKLDNLISSQEVEDIVRAEVKKFAPYGELDRAVQSAKTKILARCRVALSYKLGVEPDLYDVLFSEG